MVLGGHNSSAQKTTLVAIGLGERWEWEWVVGLETPFATWESLSTDSSSEFVSCVEAVPSKGTESLPVQLVTILESIGQSVAAKVKSRCSALLRCPSCLF